MIAEDLIRRPELEARRTGRGWSARCPAHSPDRNPSLSIREGDKGLLVRCWAGCTVEEVMSAMGLSVADLFYDSHHPPYERHRENVQPRPKRYNFRKAAAEYEDYALGLRLRAESVIAAAKGFDVSGWTTEQVDRAMRAVSKAYSDLDRAEVLDGIGFSIRARGLAKEEASASQRAA